MDNNNNNNREARYAKITDFYGDTQDPVGWLQDFENACQANTISDNRKIQIVGAYLKGAAATWLANKRLLTHDWPTQWNPTNNQQVNQLASFTCQFKIQFRTQDRIYEWQRQLKERKQLPGESVEQYAAAIRELLRRVDPDNNYPIHLQVSQFIDGLRPEIRFFVNPTRPATLEEAINTAQLHNANFQQYTQINTVPQYSIPTAPSLMTIPFLPQAQPENEVAKLNKQLEELKIQLKQTNSFRNTNNSNNSNNFNSRKHPIECYNCGKLGHFKKDCWSKRIDNNNRNNYNQNNYNKNNNNQNNQQNKRQNTYLNTEEHLNS